MSIEANNVLHLFHCIAGMVEPQGGFIWKQWDKHPILNKQKDIQKHLWSCWQASLLLFSPKALLFCHMHSVEQRGSTIHIWCAIILYAHD